MLLPMPLLLGLLDLVAAEPVVYFKEQFLDRDRWTNHWIESKNKSHFGKFVLSVIKFYGDLDKDKGLQTSQDARFYVLSARFEPFSNKDQFTVKHEQNIDCRGGYVNLFPDSLDQTDMHGDSEYKIMFGPDICGPGTKKVRVIFNYKGKNVLINKDIRCKDDELTHLYTLIVGPGNTYIDNLDYKGTWIHPEIDNPEYSFPDSSIYAYENLAILGLDLWQVKSGTIFDNFLITNDEAYAEEFGNETWGVTKAAEKQMKYKQDEEQRLKEEEEADKDEDEEEEEEDLLLARPRMSCGATTSLPGLD
ncbi:Calreticulin [Myotis davidii]|uniref:Calreticulin n=1 Tax=Myotis davidii TaxID=225400 RepID=L5LYE1_MYODS|nr:Calreticulin [Myotis davidii]